MLVGLQFQVFSTTKSFKKFINGVIFIHFMNKICNYSLSNRVWVF